MPEFVVTQGAKSLSALEEMKNYFGCGRLFINRRHDNHREDLYRYCVRAIRDLREIIIPFFEANPLRTAKKKDFELFKEAIRLMSENVHLTQEGVDRLLKLKQSYSSSETIRQSPIIGQDIVQAI